MYGPSNCFPKAFPYLSLYIQWHRLSRAVLYHSLFTKLLSVKITFADGTGQMFLRRISNGVTLNFTEKWTIFLEVPPNLLYSCHLWH
jgi:hypothetical protein